MRLWELLHYFWFDHLTQTERKCSCLAGSTWQRHFHEDEDSLIFSSNVHNLVTDPTDPPIVWRASHVMHITPDAFSSRWPSEGGTQLSRGWMSCDCLRETSAAYICPDKPAGPKKMADAARSSHSCSGNAPFFSDLFFGGSCDNVVHHILTADKQLLKEKASSVLKECRKSLHTGCFYDALRPNKFTDIRKLQWLCEMFGDFKCSVHELRWLNAFKGRSNLYLDETK